MSSVVDKLFGGTDTYGMDVAAENRRTAEEFIKQQAQQARSDVMGFYDPMTQAIQQGFQRGADVYSMAIPQQIRSLQQGAQEAYRLRAGALPFYQYALMGVPFNMPQILAQSAPPTVAAYQDVPSLGQPQVVQAVSNPLAGMTNQAQASGATMTPDFYNVQPEFIGGMYRGKEMGMDGEMP